MKLQLKEKELKFLDIAVGIKYLTRDKSGRLFLHKERPTFDITDYLWKSKNMIRIPLGLVDDLFKMVTINNLYPYSVEGLLSGEFIPISPNENLFMKLFDDNCFLYKRKNSQIISVMKNPRKILDNEWVADVVEKVPIKILKGCSFSFLEYFDEPISVKYLFDCYKKKTCLLDIETYKMRIASIEKLPRRFKYIVRNSDGELFATTSASGLTRSVIQRKWTGNGVEFMSIGDTDDLNYIFSFVGYNDEPYLIDNYCKELMKKIDFNNKESMEIVDKWKES